MKKRLLITSFLMIFILVIISVSALDISLSKSSYYPEETLQAQITGNFISLKPDNILIYKQGLQHSNPAISGLTFQGGIYYFYAILPTAEGNYSIKIQGAKYNSGGETKTDDISQSFTIEKTNQSYISVNPGFIISSKDFLIKVKSLNGNSEVSANFASQSKNLSLVEDTEQTLSFYPEENFNSISINNYNIPVFLTIPSNSTGFINYNSDLVFMPSNLNATITTGNTYLFNIIIKNIGNTNLTNITLSSDLNALISPTTISSLAEQESYPINVTMLIANSDTNVSGYITADHDGEITELPVYFLITKNQTNVDLSGTSSTQTLSCSEIGILCKSNEGCNGDTTASIEGPCCIGQCAVIAPPSSNSMMWGIILMIVLVIAIGGFYYYLKKNQKPKSSDEILKEKTDKFKKRMSDTGKEVSESLGRV